MCKHFHAVLLQVFFWCNLIVELMKWPPPSANRLGRYEPANLCSILDLFLFLVPPKNPKLLDNMNYCAGWRQTNLLISYKPVLFIIMLMYFNEDINDSCPSATCSTFISYCVIVLYSNSYYKSSASSDVKMFSTGTKPKRKIVSAISMHFRSKRQALHFEFSFSGKSRSSPACSCTD